MKCIEYFQQYWDDICNLWMQEMIWEKDGYNSDTLFKAMCADADKRGVELLDKEDFDYDPFFWNIWESTEKGLS